MTKEYLVIDNHSKNELWTPEKQVRKIASVILYENGGSNKSYMEIEIDNAIQIINDDGRFEVTTKIRKVK